MFQILILLFQKGLLFQNKLPRLLNFLIIHYFIKSPYSHFNIIRNLKIIRFNYSFLQQIVLRFNHIFIIFQQVFNIFKTFNFLNFLFIFRSELFLFHLILHFIYFIHKGSKSSHIFFQ